MDRQPSILVIDDEPVVCESCQRILLKEDFKVDTNTNPKEAYNQALINNYDLILLDLIMDEMDGIELLSALREEKPDIPVIIITGYPTKKSKQEATDLGVSDYIIKPFMPKELLDPVNHIIEHTELVEKKDLIDLRQIIGLPKWERSEEHFMFYKEGWSQKGWDGSYRVGGQLSDLTDETILSITIPNVNNVIYRDSPLAEITLSNNTKRIIPSSVSGRIVEVNTELENDLPFIENNMYNKFWVARVLPRAIEEDIKHNVTRNLLFFTRNTDNRNRYYNQLIDLGYIVQQTSSIEEVVKIIIEDQLKTVILDVGSFFSEGPEYVKLLHKKFPNLKIIVFDRKENDAESRYHKNWLFSYCIPPTHTKEISDILYKAFATTGVDTIDTKYQTAFQPEVIDKIHIINRYYKKETGIYFMYDDENENADFIDMTELSSYADEIPGIGAIWHSHEFPIMDANTIAERIRETHMKRIIIAGDSPGKVKDLFVRAMIITGNDPKDVVLASFRDHGAVYRSDTERAKSILFCALYGLFYEEVAKPGENPVNVDTLVIGGGIAGIQASLEIANSGNKVFLVEKSGTTGGHMATFDKTFPTLDCAACILTPKMVEVGQHPNIELMTYSEVVGVSGNPGNYKVTIFRKARYVNLKKCTGCGICATKCPTSVPSEFDSGTTLRKAIYIPFPQAVPNKYLVDAAHCRYIQEGKCGICAKACPVEDCINLSEKDKTVEITVGNIILATGFKPFDARRIEDYGYGEYSNVLTSLEFERLVNASGPTEGKIKLRTRDKKGNWIFTPNSNDPESIAIIHCVGSRDVNYNAFCSRVCCMYSLKLAHLAKEKLPNARISEYYIDMRAFGKGYEEFYNRIKREGVHIVRGRPGKIEKVGDQLLLRNEDILNNTMIEDKVDMVVLSVGLEPSEDTGKLSKMLKVPTTEDGWFMEANNIFDPVNTRSGGIMLAGVCQGPKDIPSTVAQASAAASRVLQSIVRKKVHKNASDLSLKKIEKNIQQLSNIKMVCYERVN